MGRKGWGGMNGIGLDGVGWDGGGSEKNTVTCSLFPFNLPSVFAVPDCTFTE